MASFEGVSSAEAFAKRYELHYQPRKIEVEDVDVQGQYGCLNFMRNVGSASEAYSGCEE
jgi:hypothetical protein